METKRTVLFIDAENLFYIQKSLGWEIDFEKLYNFFAEKTYIYNAFYYTAIDQSDEEKYKEKSQFLNSLGPLGYTVRTKEVKIIKTADGGVVKKGNMDIELVVDMFNTKDLYKQVILFSGDSDFTRALELLRTHGKEIIVISSKGFVSREIVNAADKYIDISKLRKHIEKGTPSTSTGAPHHGAPHHTPHAATPTAKPKPRPRMPRRKKPEVKKPEQSKGPEQQKPQQDIPPKS